MTASPTSLELQLKGYRLTTAEIVYRMPDHPGVLQSFVWQLYDLAPSYPELKKFLDFWVCNIEGRLHTVRIASKQIITPPTLQTADAVWNLH